MADPFIISPAVSERLKERAQRRQLGIETDSTDSFKSLMGSIASGQRARKGIKALGKEVKPPQRRGILETLFDQQKGILTSPFRAVTAFGSAIAGGPETEGMDPIEAVYRSAVKGEFAVTGGDVLRVNSDDSLLERLGKYAGALAFDIALDPVSYVGPVNLFTKKGAAVLSVRQGEKMFSIADDILRKAGRADRSLEIGEELFRKSRTFQAAELQRLTGTKIDPGTPLDLLKIGPDGVVDQSVKAGIINSQFGLEIGEAILKGGRPQVLKTATRLLGSEELAKQFMLRLPNEIAGGLFLKNPFTGAPIKRLLGGQGGGGEVIERINQARLAVSASPPVNFFTEFFSGKSGIVYADVKRGLLPKSGLSDLERTTLLDFVGYKKFLSTRNMELSQMGQEINAVLSGALATAKRLGSDDAEKQYLAALETGFFSPAAPINPNLTRAQTEGYAAAANIRRLMSEYHQTARELGIDVGDLGPNYSPLMLTEEAYERRLNRGYLGGEKREKVQYAGGYGRRTLAEYSEDPEMRAILGTDAPGRTNVVLLNAKYANDRLRKAGKLAEGKFEFEENPLKVAQMYLGWIHNTIASKRAADVAVQTGALLRLPARIRKVLDTQEAASFYEAAKQMAPNANEAVARARVILDDMEKKYEEMLDPKKLEEVQAQVAGTRGEALTSYRDAKEAEAAAREAVRQADNMVASTEPSLTAAINRLRSYGRSGNEQVIENVGRLIRNARARRARAAAKREVAIEEASEATLRIEERGLTQRRQDLRNAAQDRANAAAARETEEADLVFTLRQEIDDARALAETLGAEQVQDFVRYQEALAAQAQAVDILSTARARREAAVRVAQAAKEDTTILRATAIDEVVESYVEAKSRYLKIKSTLAKPRKDLGYAEQLGLDIARATLAATEERMKRILGYATKRSGAGAQYAREIVRLASKLPQQEMTVARVIANADRLNTLLDSVPDFTRADAMDTMRDLYTAYKSIRRYVSPEELDRLTKLEQRVLSGPFSRLVTEKRDISPAAEELFERTEGRIAKVGSGRAGLETKIPSTIQDTFAPAGIRKAMETLYRAELDPSEFQKWMARIYDPAALVWKTGVTVGRGPGYSFTNLVGALVNNFIARVSPRNHSRSAATLNKAVTILRDVTKKNPNKSFFELVEIGKERLENEIGDVKVNGRPVIELFFDFLDRGGHFSTDLFYQMNELQRLGVNIGEPLTRRSGIQFRFEGEPTGPIEDKYRAFVTFMLGNPVQRVFNDIAQLSELFPRFAAFLDGFERFGDLESAMDLVHMLHFDYQDLSEFEVWIKRLVPFYTWTRNNVPLQLRAAFLASDQVAKLYTANAELREAFEVDGEASWINDYLPDYMVINGGFATAIKAGSGYLGLTPKLPMQDADRFFGTVFIGGLPIPWPRRDAIMSSLGPVIKTPTEFITGRNYELGYEYGSDLELIQGQARTLIPYYGTARRFLSSLGLPVDREKRVSNLLNLLVGAPYGATIINEKTLTRAAINNSEEYNKQLRKAAEEAGVDIDWLRKELRKGTNLAQLTAMIGAGAGSIERVAEQERRALAAGKGPRVPDYLSEIRELQQR